MKLSISEELRKKVSPELITKIEQRLADAERKGIWERAFQVADTFGKSDDDSFDGEGPTDSEYSFTGEGMVIIRKDGSAWGDGGIKLPYQDILILVSDHPVFKTEKGVLIAYIPGVWEEALDKHYENALEAQRSAKKYSAERKLLLQRQADAEEAHQWGL